MHENYPSSVIRHPFTVYRASHRDESLKGLDDGDAYVFSLSHVWLWAKGLKRLDDCAAYFSDLSAVSLLIKGLKSLMKLASQFKPFQAVRKARMRKLDKVCTSIQAFSSFFKPFTTNAHQRNERKRPSTTASSLFPLSYQRPGAHPFCRQRKKGNSPAPHLSSLFPTVLSR